MQKALCCIYFLNFSFSSSVRATRRPTLFVSLGNAQQRKACVLGVCTLVVMTFLLRFLCFGFIVLMLEVWWTTPSKALHASYYDLSLKKFTPETPPFSKPRIQRCSGSTQNSLRQLVALFVHVAGQSTFSLPRLGGIPLRSTLRGPA